VEYLVENCEAALSLADLSEENLKRTSSNIPGVKVLVRNAGEDAGELLDEICPDVLVNLLPPSFMAPVAAECLRRSVPLVHPAYLDGETRAMAREVEAAGIPFVTELGLDPGIDHMSAARTIRRIHEAGGKVISFRSVCGALPSAGANTNPWGYKLSWAPASLIGASKRDARILLDGVVHDWPGGKTYENVYLEEIDDLGCFEIYANADSLPYIETYGIPEAVSIFRGTIRYPGWCETICKMNALGLFEESELDLDGQTYRTFLARMAGSPETDDLESLLCARLWLEPYSTVMLRFRWLGLLDDKPLPFTKGSPRDVVSSLFGEKLIYRDGERDLVILQDDYVARFPEEGIRKRFRSTLVDYGLPGGDSSIARTTGLPPAIAARFILEGKIRTPGVHIPVLPEIYEPVLAELELLGISLKESEEILEG
jgi:saccharopine dehydrogenase-like NADP-dependent oxidoreductase